MYQLKQGESDCTQLLLNEFDNRPSYCRSGAKWANRIPKVVSVEIAGQMYEYLGATGMYSNRVSNLFIYGLTFLSVERKKVLICLLRAGKLRIIHTIQDQYLITLNF